MIGEKAGLTARSLEDLSNVHIPFGLIRNSSVFGNLSLVRVTAQLPSLGKSLLRCGAALIILNVGGSTLARDSRRLESLAHTIGNIG